MSLYDDIRLNPRRGESLLVDTETYEETISRLTHENQHATTQVKALQDSVTVLERNISCLYATAKLEIRRKDAEIVKLRELVELERLGSALQQDAVRELMDGIHGLMHMAALSTQSPADRLLALLEGLRHTLPPPTNVTDARETEFAAIQAEMKNVLAAVQAGIPQPRVAPGVPTGTLSTLPAPVATVSTGSKAIDSTAALSHPNAFEQGGSQYPRSEASRASHREPLREPLRSSLQPVGPPLSEHQRGRASAPGDAYSRDRRRSRSPLRFETSNTHDRRSSSGYNYADSRYGDRHRSRSRSPPSHSQQQTQPRYSESNANNHRSLPGDRYGRGGGESLHSRSERRSEDYR